MPALKADFCCIVLDLKLINSSAAVFFLFSVLHTGAIVAAK